MNNMNQKNKAKIKERDSLKIRGRGELIAAIRKKLGYSQEELEWRSGVSKTQISRIERDCTNPSIETIKKLESALDVPLMDLFLNYENTDTDMLIHGKHTGRMLIQFEKQLAQKQLSPDEVGAILKKTLDEIEEKKESEAKKGDVVELTDEQLVMLSNDDGL